MKLYLLEGNVIHHCGELSVEEPFQGFVQDYFIETDYVGFDGYRFPASEVAITKVTEVNSNTSQRLRLVLTKEIAVAKPSPIATMIGEVRAHLTKYVPRNPDAEQGLKSTINWLDVWEAKLMVAERSKHRELENWVLGFRRETMSKMRQLNDLNK